ncbi:MULTISPECIES: hypothetical protein [unclassified Streptomyces]|uniref:hypothetical protein n=1 Tax=unclassified Streptomyces TaxID=2593676 RepID=UPI0035D67BD8
MSAEMVCSFCQEGNNRVSEAMQDLGEGVETDLVAPAIGILTGAVTSFGQETATGVVRLVPEWLAATP